MQASPLVGRLSVNAGSSADRAAMPPQPRLTGTRFDALTGTVSVLRGYLYSNGAYFWDSYVVIEHTAGMVRGPGRCRTVPAVSSITMQLGRASAPVQAHSWPAMVCCRDHCINIII